MSTAKRLLRSILRRLVNENLRNRARLGVMSVTHTALRQEVARLPVVKSGVEDVDGRSTPFVVLEDGVILYGRWPNAFERLLYQNWQHIIPATVHEDAIRVALDVIERYLYPHAMPHLTMPYPRSDRRRFHRQHAETITDLPNISSNEIVQIQERFRPKPGESFLDIGAYIGFGTVRMGNILGKDALILAVEADPDTLWLLRKNLEVNDLANVRIISKAIWSEPGQLLTFYKSGRQANALDANLVKAQNEVTVETVTVDAILAEAGEPCVDYISMTVNGAEVEAVAGSTETLQRCRSLRLSIAGWYKHNGQRGCDIIVPTLKGYGFSCVVGRQGGILAWK